MHETQQGSQQAAAFKDDGQSEQENQHSNLDNTSPASDTQYLPTSVVNMNSVASLHTSMGVHPNLPSMAAPQMISPQLLQQQL